MDDFIHPIYFIHFFDFRKISKNEEKRRIPKFIWC